VAIRSHPGVRSDLFHRPLEQTLITDFFGGVAHAEVITDRPTERYPRIPDSSVAETDSMETQLVHVHELAEVLQTSTNGTGIPVNRLLRAWISVGIIVILVARAKFKTKR
jgi:phosphatidylinositol glycan class K